MKNTISAKKKTIVFIYLILAVLVVAVGGTLAVYTSQDHQRSVVRNRDTDTIRFSSDKLYRVISGTEAQKYYCPMGKDERTMAFYVCNYDQSKPALFQEKDIEYDIEFSVENGSESSYRISNGKETKTIQGDKEICKFENESLSGGQKFQNQYSFTFGEQDFNQVQLHVKVTPKNPSLTQNRILNGILIPIEHATTQGISLKSEFTDCTRENPDKFDAYNLAVTISGGQGNVEMQWDSTQLDIDPFFLEKLNITKDKIKIIEDVYYKITFPMNSENETGTYLIQFYNHNMEKPDWTEWSSIPITVKLQENVTP